jgi:hypothetical protein
MHESRTIEADAGYNADRTADPSPARQMAAAMVNVAVKDVQHLAKRWQLDPTAKPKKHERSALAWVQNATSCAPFGFRWCCDVAGVDVGAARSLLLSWLRVAPQTQGTESWAG